MSRLKLLDAAEIRRFDLPPLLTRQQQAHYFTLPSDGLPQFRKPVTRIGFCLQWGYFRLTQKFFRAADFHPADIDYVTQRFQSQPVDLADYSTQIAWEHGQLILGVLHIKPFEAYRDSFNQLVYGLFEQPLLPRKVLEESRQHLMRQRVEVPSYDVFLRIITEQYNHYGRRLSGQLEQHLTEHHRQALEQLIQTDTAYERPLLQTFRVISQVEQPKAIKASLALFKQVKTLFEQVEGAVNQLGFSDATLSHYAHRTGQDRPGHIKEHESRHLFLLCFLVHQYRVRQDTFVDMVLSCVKATEHVTGRKRQQLYFATNRQRRSATLLTIRSRHQYARQIEQIRQVMTLDEEPITKLARIDAVLALEPPLTGEQQTLVNQLDGEMHRSEEQEKRTLLGERSAWLGNRLTGILGVLHFNPHTSDAVLLSAIKHYVQRHGKPTTPAKDLSWLSETDQQALFDADDRFNRRLYRVLLMSTLAHHLREGTMNLKHSYRYRSLDEYLVDKPYYQANRERLLAEAGLSHFADSKRVLQTWRTQLATQYAQTNEHQQQGKNPHLSFDKENRPIIDTPKVYKPDVGRISDYFNPARYISVLNLLAQVDSSAHFLTDLEHLAGKHSKGRPAWGTFFAAIVALGCNIGVDKMAAICKGVNASTLQLTVDMFLSSESLKAANDRLIRLKEELALPELHRRDVGQRHTASDGQKYLVTEDSLNADFSYKYPGFDKAVTVNTGIDDRFALFHTSVVSAAEREAPYMIDIHLHNPVVKSTIHSTDTHGFSEAVFGIMHLLDIFFAPRLKGIGKLHLYDFMPAKHDETKAYKILPDGTVNESLIEGQWEDMLRLMVSLKLKRVTAWQVLKRLSTYTRQHPLYRAMKEFGRLVKTDFILRYYDELTLRQSIEKQLSRIELVNRFSKAVFFGGNQVFGVATKEEQEKIIHARRLIQNAIILWNYLYLSELLSRTSEQPQLELTLDAVRNGTAIVWHHVNLQGEYDVEELMSGSESRFDWSYLSGLRWPTAEKEELQNSI